MLFDILVAILLCITLATYVSHLVLDYTHNMMVSTIVFVIVFSLILYTIERISNDAYSFD